MGSHFITEALGQPQHKSTNQHWILVGASLLAMTADQPTMMLTGSPLSRASSLPQERCVLFSAAGFSQGNAAHVRSGR
ncbi:hypothetical protein EPZ47_23320 [Pseudomonas viciae]|uniref:Uncharacterized protein n=1 Tax=Pseudomonas viciae TaxID=2505979 RepID=A0A4P7PLG0_9PSED|nr:hypothetical protein EPZ47_23320 [Pseudomonas viciae]